MKAKNERQGQNEPCPSDEILVGGKGIEPLTFGLYDRRSPAELNEMHLFYIKYANSLILLKIKTISLSFSI